MTTYAYDMLGTSLAAVGNGNAEAFSLTAFGDTIPGNAKSGESARSPLPVPQLDRQSICGGGSPFYTGKPDVPGLGHAFLFRNYRASLGKWQTSDPIGYPDGWNQLAYCGNGVASAVDLWGCLTVNVWDSSEDGWDHASITLDDGTYISWWPDDDAEGKIGKSDGPLGNIYDASAIKNRTYEDDFSDEKKREPWKKDISGLNEEAIKQWWDDFSNNPENLWSTFSQNCSTVAAKALLKGGAKTPWCDIWNGWNIIWTPEDVRRFAEAIVE